MHQRPSAERHRPSVVVRCTVPGADSVRGIRAGLEEEGVPVRVEPAPSDDAAVLAFAAAQASSLGVGIGVDDAGTVCLHHAKRPPGSPVLSGPPAVARVLGHNAARLVVGLPLKTLPDWQGAPFEE
ncbi:glycerol dehydratase reactivase beta/small subunit family protein [Saccharomonospora sp. NPDC046836]|uniref:glycerol dehydratase reactivase beta/small subunit family protein n=1 Tax=Saccharomonospora sp. NPDC046836 TaxID=3156921 RepID=UPI0033E0CACC